MKSKPSLGSHTQELGARKAKKADLQGAPEPTGSTSLQGTLSLGRIFRVWWPLALGWILMTIEIPILVAIVARSANPEINLAAWGITFFVTLIIGSPAIMLLATSTALSKDWSSYVVLRRFVLSLLTILTAVHATIVFTPLYTLVVVHLIGAPEEIVEPARLGLMIMLPWAFGVGYRRFNYGVLIRFHHSKAVTHGVVIRLSVNSIILIALLSWGQLSGIVIASTAFTVGILIEALYAHWRVQPVLQGQLRVAPKVGEYLTLGLFLRFFVPLALTAMLQLSVQPIVSAALSRMPDALGSLAVWPVIFSLLILFTSAGTAFTEVVVVLLEDAQANAQLWRFSGLIMMVSTALLLLMVVTPLSQLWFRHVAALPEDLIAVAVWGLWFVLPMPILRVLQSFYQGSLMVAKKTQGITKSVVVYLLISGCLLWLGVAWGQTSGLFIGLLVTVIAETARTGWLWRSNWLQQASAS